MISLGTETFIVNIRPIVFAVLIFFQPAIFLGLYNTDKKLYLQNWPADERSVCNSWRCCLLDSRIIAV